MVQKEIKSASFLKGILNLTWVIFIFLIASSIHITLTSGESINLVIIQIILFLAYAFFMFSIIMSLRRIIISIINKNPFITQNITRFRKIGIYILILTIGDAIINAAYKEGPKIISIEPLFNLTLESFIMIIVGCLAFVLAEVFRMAMEIKNENDLTI